MYFYVYVYIYIYLSVCVSIYHLQNAWHTVNTM